MNLSTPPFSKHTVHSCLFLLDSVAVPVHDGPRCTSTSPLCFPWKAGVKVPPPSCAHQRLVLREFPISPDGTAGFTGRAAETRRTNQGGALPRAPCLTSALWIRYHSTVARGTLSQGPGFLGSLEQFDLYKESVGPPCCSMGVSL